VKTLREYLDQQYRVVGRVVVPILFAGLIAPHILQRVTWIPHWALDVTFSIAIVMVLLLFGRIRCPRCHRALGIRTQAQTSRRGRPGMGITPYTLRDIKCPHCGLTLDEPM
jgi:DNA-directed RNA polymerase subunit RPC12/RpoP